MPRTAASLVRSQLHSPGEITRNLTSEVVLDFLFRPKKRPFIINQNALLNG